MSIPLDNLYHWVESLLPGPCALYLFYPHGHKDISHISLLDQYNDHCITPSILMHDQEPLDYELYADNEKLTLNQNLLWPGNVPQMKVIEKALDELTKKHMPGINLLYVPFQTGSQIYDQMMLVHSEKNSNDLEKYINDGYVCVYYWAHAVIALDWFRFAKMDGRLKRSTVDKKFLIYCRDWSNRREYRLKFLSLLIENQLVECSNVTVLKTNTEGQRYDAYKFNNSDFDVSNLSELELLEDNNHLSSSSADYVPQDFAESAISVVLETEFDGARIHLTEKILRAIACKHPFILAAGPNSLEYLRSYGFQTFSPWIDESYDLETNSVTRLEKIINSMKKINDQSPKEFAATVEKINEIAEYNQKHFFSSVFFEQVSDELEKGLCNAYDLIICTRGKKFLHLQKLLKKHNHALIRDPVLVPFRTKSILKLRQLRRNA